ncbi:EAL domain-containing response regulator [Rhodopseudomonas sp. BR0M22]|uniref:EAL domain-containing response regulator n=1 Tax=Rhodopseudomonas sp. BR0M22 TaxID=2269369 RepID=UPI0013DF9B45|nr:EAL domain-containing response regulator [Rhodopseudomonas sp. BR0M22]NEW93932.1 EAL domain-containing protein [Rhodopseudomonas sp. BR0M22]
MQDRTSSDPAIDVLVVDDDPLQGAIISGVCIKLGYRPHFAASYQEAADRLAADRYDYVTIDLSLGDHDGIELLRLIADHDTKPRRIIVISGCDQRILNATVRMAHAVGMLDTVSLPKPIDLTLLRSALSTLPESAALRRRSDAGAACITTADLSRGIDNGEVYAAFQPKIDLASGKVIGCEALARWDSPTFGAVGPDLFIPLAEQGGLIKAITFSMLRDAMRFAAAFIATEPRFVVAVNLSASLLSDTSLPEEIEHLLAEIGVPARALMVEITETTAMADVGRAMDVLLRLRLKGVGISMDDFGTGYSSLSALARMPFSELKIDRSFVKDCLTDADMWKIVSSSVAIAHQYNMKVVAEGIEDTATWRALDALGCDIGQGYEFSRALPQDAFVDWYRGWTARHPGEAAAMLQRGA